jgi:microcystin-dependent protein
MSFFKWSKTANNNATADPSINWAEGQAPSTVNDSARALMAAAAKYRDDVAGIITTGGTSTIYTLTSNQQFDSLANMDGKLIGFVPHVTNAAGIQLNVDGLGAKSITVTNAIPLEAGVLIAGTPYAAVYNNAQQQWRLFGFSPSEYDIPLATGLPYFGTSAPNSKFAFPFGQAISRTTYANLFTLFGITYGAGDGSTTFNLPDLRGRALFGKDDMGGTAANRVTGGGSGIDGTTLGAAGGTQSVTLAQGNLPNVNLSALLSVSGGTSANGVGIAISNSGTGISTQAAATGISCSITAQNAAIVTGGGNIAGVFGSGTTGVNVTDPTHAHAVSDPTHTHTHTHTHGYSDPGHSHSISGTASGSVSLGGSGTAVNKMPPAIMANFIIRVL